MENFKNELFNVNAEIKNGEVLFDVESVSRSLGFIQIAKSGNEVVRWERVNKYLNDLGHPHQLGTGDLISESFVYLLAMKGGTEKAKEFQRWVATEVLPSIRKTGSYNVKQLGRKELAKMVIEAEEENERLQLELKEQAPKVEYHDTVLRSVSLITTTQIAQDFGLSAKKLNSMLEKQKIHYKQSGQWILYAKYKNKGYVQSDTATYKSASTGKDKTRMHTKWTEEGRLFITKLLKDKYNIDPVTV